VAAIARIEAAQRQPRGAAIASVADSGLSQKQAAVLKLVTAYRSRGHLAARLDPLDMGHAFPSSDLEAIGLLPRPGAPDLQPEFHGLSNADLDTEFNTGSLAGPQKLKLRDLVALCKTYADSIGAEFMHISDVEQRQWVHEQLERAGGNSGLTAEDKKRVLEKLVQADGLERYLHTKYVGQKRFSLEGGDSLIPMLDELVRRGGTDGMRDMVVGMAHRGRLNVLVNVLGKSPEKLFAEFDGKFDHPDDPAHSGDVKYHMGFSANVKTPGRTVHLALAFNPSHLEIVNPVVCGSVRARQTHRHDEQREQVVPILIHGDAAFAGQGVNMELLNMSQARGFCVGGSIHIVINNQVGFTTSNPHDARSTLYCTDVAKMVNAPVFHVNGDDPDAVVFVTRLAFDFRQKFKRDVVIDLVCYRRHGHNEADEPSATQPLMYQIIRARPTERELYAKKLVAEGVIADGDLQKLMDAYRAKLEAGKPIADLDPDFKDDFAVDWTRHIGALLQQPVITGVQKDELAALNQKILTLPSGVVLHPRVAKIYEDRLKMAAGEQPMDWGFAENLAYASLLADDCNLRLVGQDSGRGTFFHRHAVLHDQNSGGDYVPLANVREGANVTIIDSLLSEEAVMAYEYGYSTSEPNTLVLWEGQFGDFANGAQVVIDQFISSGEAKWDRLSGLVLLLPHGYEGQGPEHSSARLERYLQLCALDNMQVCADDARADVPPVAPPDAARLPQAAHRDDAEVAAAPQARGVDARRTRQRRLPADDPGQHREGRPEGVARRAVLGQGLLRPRRGSRQARRQRRRHRPRRTALSVPARRGRCRTAQVRRAQGRDLVSGRADEPGCVVSDPPSPADRRARGHDAHVRGPLALARAGVRPPVDAHRRAGGAGRGGAGRAGRQRKRFRITATTFPSRREGNSKSPRTTPCRLKSRFPFSPSPSPTPRSRPGTRSRATRFAATRISSTSRPTRSCSKSPRRPTACSRRSSSTPARR
jgi:2-oxoglutarate dehydrogenase E1 component